MLNQKLKTTTICGSIGQHKGLLKDEECRMLFDYLNENTKKQNYFNESLPWLYGNNLVIESIEDKAIKQLEILA